MSVHTLRHTCRACGGRELRRFLSLGPTPLANSFLASPLDFSSEASYPLDIYFCVNCSLVQLLDVINPEMLFRNYIYLTGTSDTISSHNQQYAKTVIEMLGMGAQDMVVEIASNDGSLIKCFQQNGNRILGIEPATNIARLANEKGIETLNLFFNEEAVEQIIERYGLARAVVANNVLAHVDDTQGFLRGCKSLLSPDGLVIIEVPSLKDLLYHLEFDTIYHEHLCYFSISALVPLYDSVGLSIVRVDQMPVHGGTLRIYAGKREFYGDHADQVFELVEEERKLRMNEFILYQEFAVNVERSRKALLDLLHGLKRQGKSLAGYGAPAKGNTLLNYCGITTDLIPFTVDKSPLKIGLHTPGMHIPVLPVTALLDRQPDYVLILAWNFAAEIIRQQAEYVRRGGKFILPLPIARVVE